MEYDTYVIRGILAKNQFGIMVVNDLQCLKSLNFVPEDFLTIEKLIQINDIKAIRNFSQNTFQKGTRMYLDIMSFTDQSNKLYIVAVFNSDALEQNPQVIEIYSTTLSQIS